jgi:hypothetical protein
MAVLTTLPKVPFAANLPANQSLTISLVGSRICTEMAQMRTNCIVSLKEALRQTGLDNQYSSMPPSLMAARLRPKPQARPTSYEASHLGEAQKPRGDTTSSWRPIVHWVLILALVLGLIPSLSIGAFIWFEKPRTMSAYPCPLRTSTGLVLSSNL